MFCFAQSHLSGAPPGETSLVLDSQLLDQHRLENEKSWHMAK